MKAEDYNAWEIPSQGNVRKTRQKIFNFLELLNIIQLLGGGFGIYLDHSLTLETDIERHHSPQR